AAVVALGAGASEAGPDADGGGVGVVVAAGVGGGVEDGLAPGGEALGGLDHAAVADVFLGALGAGGAVGGDDEAGHAAPASRRRRVVMRSLRPRRWRNRSRDLGLTPRRSAARSKLSP